MPVDGMLLGWTQYLWGFYRIYCPACFLLDHNGVNPSSSLLSLCLRLAFLVRHMSSKPSECDKVNCRISSIANRVNCIWVVAKDVLNKSNIWHVAKATEGANAHFHLSLLQRRDNVQARV
jgi:hypothetical protein